MNGEILVETILFVITYVVAKPKKEKSKFSRTFCVKEKISGKLKK